VETKSPKERREPPAVTRRAAIDENVEGEINAALPDERPDEDDQEEGAPRRDRAQHDAEQRVVRRAS